MRWGMWIPSSEVRKEIFVPHKGSRKGATKILLVITDGRKNDVLSYEKVIEEAEEAGIIRYAIGVGAAFSSNRAKEELYAIASKPDKDHVFTVDNFDALKGIQDQLQDKIFAIEGTQSHSRSSFQMEMSQEGFSALLTLDGFVLGAVGAHDWSGGVFLYQNGSRVPQFIHPSSTTMDMSNAYLGYSSQFVQFSGRRGLVLGAPRYDYIGKVFLFERDARSGGWLLKAEALGKQMKQLSIGYRTGLKKCSSMASSHIGESLGMLIVGLTPELNVTAAIRNHGEDSYTTKLCFVYPAGVSYRKVTLLPHSRKVVSVKCYPAPVSEENANRTTTCNINHPIFWSEGEIQQKKVILVSSAQISYDEEKYTEKEGFAQTQVQTVVERIEFYNYLPVIIGSSLGGLVLLAVLVAVLYKVGFFKRQYKELMKEEGPNGEATDPTTQATDATDSILQELTPPSLAKTLPPPHYDSDSEDSEVASTSDVVISTQGPSSLGESYVTFGELMMRLTRSLEIKAQHRFDPNTDKRLLRFTVDSDLFELNVLPFELATVPQVFMKCMALVCAHLRLQGIQVYPYLNDWLIVSPTKEGLRSSLQTVCTLLDNLGLCINHEKSCLTPSQVIDFIGACLDSMLTRAFLPQSRQDNLCSSIRRIHMDRAVPALSVQKLLGHMASTVSTVPHARLRMRPLQLWFNGMFQPQ
ncbi:Integrin alpha-X [Varanus komodoensis]|nr:Integrin alpha-X [Varanus komodoensis]